MLNWYQKQLGSRAELSRPGDDEYSVYIHVDVGGGREVLAVFLVPETVDEFIEAIKERIRYLEEKEIFVDYIDVWVPPDWIDKLEDVVEGLNEGVEGLPLIRIRDSTQLNIPISALKELISRSGISEAKAPSPNPRLSKRLESRFVEDKKTTLKKKGVDVTPVTEEKLEEILERVIRRVEGERRISNVERTVDELQRRISLLEEVIKFLISSRETAPQPPLDSSLVLSKERSIEKKEVKEEVSLRKAEPKAVLKPQPREYSSDLFEEYVKDNPWADVLKERCRREEDDENTT
ncbi:MAG TPA: hypothetical protein EYP68_04010 [Candidatus Korarchaeota archaeon]|nr:hypothetical protein [Candidatus Korarchaeota archaeon]